MNRAKSITLASLLTVIAVAKNMNSVMEVENKRSVNKSQNSQKRTNDVAPHIFPNAAYSSGQK